MSQYTNGCRHQLVSGVLYVCMYGSRWRIRHDVSAADGLVLQLKTQARNVLSKSPTATIPAGKLVVHAGITFTALIDS